VTTRLFCSWVRRGAAAGITEPDPESGPFAGPATFEPSVTMALNGAAGNPIPGPNLPLLGPGAIVGIHPNAIVRVDPAPAATGVEDNYLPLLELARPDLPWLFTPAKPSAANRLRPWLVLVVVEAAGLQIQPGTPLPRITVNDAQLPDLNDSWAWAHGQVTVEDPATAPQALTAPYGAGAISRLLCPRRLQADTAYLACLVPSTLAGVQAGLGLPIDPGPSLALAWTAGAGQDVMLPVFYSWTFSTGDDGDFKSLVERLKGVRPDTIAGFGTRTIDMSSPWESPPQLGPGVNIELDGALGIGVDRPGTFAGSQAAFESRLTTLLNFPATLDPTSSSTPPSPSGDPAPSAIAPPIYAGRMAGITQIPADDAWPRQLNLDPRRRIAAAFGAKYVRDHKEFLMARAWDQLGAVQEANRLGALAELAAEVADRLHVRHLSNLNPSELFAVAAPARTRVLVESSKTLQAATATTPLPPGAGTVAFTRLVRPLGPVGRRAYSGVFATATEQTINGTVLVAAINPNLDGIANLATQPVLAGPSIDATAVMVSQAWNQITAVEQTITVPPNVQIMRQVLTAPTSSVGIALSSGTPVTIAANPAPQPTSAASLASTVMNALLPSSGILRRLADRIVLPGSLQGTGTVTRVMAGPEFPAPLALALVKEHPDYLLPGLGKFPDDSVTLLSASSAFVEAFLAGANGEMNRELLWREYPTDQRGTPFRCFWPRPDGLPDIPPISRWPLTNNLGENMNGQGIDWSSILVLLVRGEILRRYPRTVVYAAPGRIDGQTVTLDDSLPWTPPEFVMPLDATTTAFAYPLMEWQVRSNFANNIAGFYFVFSEPITGPRFRFGAPPSGTPTVWADLAWDSVPQSRGFAIVGGTVVQPPAGENAPGAARWNNDAADMGRIAFARPVRVGYHADELLPKQ
jgi:hypothetical protein